MVRTKSDPNLRKRALGEGTKRSKLPMDDPGVHGGEYSVRPNMEESMTFLKKLFTHQQDGRAGFPRLLSPPDSPQRKFFVCNFVVGTALVCLIEILTLLTITVPTVFNKKLQKDIRSSSTGRIAQLPLQGTSVVPTGALVHPSGTTHSVQMGVYTIQLQKKNQEDEDSKELESIKRICLHNASVCESLGDNEKEGVWKLLAQTVENQMDDAGKELNGWGGSGGGALGVDLVSNLLKYYESRGDVQMLATVFCVLSGGHRRRTGRPCLLPQDQDGKYDMYIRNYADLLYAWEMLSLRAELNKHLLRTPPPLDIMLTEDKTTETGRSPGIAVIFKCPRCGQNADSNTNICKKCKDFCFRCSICDNAVRGLFTVCDICHHGGHVEHMTSWFVSHVECPTGCGCNCTFSPLLQPPAPPPTADVVGTVVSLDDRITI
jgi:hypothetical protein